MRAAFPSWLTIPGTKWLSMARAWHFFFAWVFVVNGIAFVLYAIFQPAPARDLAPTGADLKGIGASIKDHLLFRHPSGEAAKRYNVLQKFAYLVVIFILLPLVILMGFAMSPWLDSLFAGWVDIFGGRQAARTIHFIVAWLLVAFVLIHVFEVIVTGLWNNLRSMITGRYRVTQESGTWIGRQKPRRRFLARAAAAASAIVAGRLRPAFADDVVSQSARRGGAMELQRGARRRRRARRWRRSSPSRTRSPTVSQQRHGGPRHRRIQRDGARTALPTIDWPSPEWSRSR